MPTDTPNIILPITIVYKFLISVIRQPIVPIALANIIALRLPSQFIVTLEKVAPIIIPNITLDPISP